MAKAGANARVALVTGGASGIGLATVKRLLEAGWKVAAVDRDEKLLASVARELGQPKRVFTSPLDVTDEAAAEKIVAMAAEALGGLDGVVNSAGIAADIHALDTPVALFRKILDVNVVGTFIVARAAARIMKDRGGGSIVNISSISGVRGSKGRSAYGSSKGAVIVLTQVLRHPRQCGGAGSDRDADGEGAALRQRPQAVDALPAAAPLRHPRGDRERHRVPARRHALRLHYG